MFAQHFDLWLLLLLLFFRSFVQKHSCTPCGDMLGKILNIVFEYRWKGFSECAHQKTYTQNLVIVVIVKGIFHFVCKFFERNLRRTVQVHRSKSVNAFVTNYCIIYFLHPVRCIHWIRPFNVCSTAHIFNKNKINTDLIGLMTLHSKINMRMWIKVWAKFILNFPVRLLFACNCKYTFLRPEVTSFRC